MILLSSQKGPGEGGGGGGHKQDQYGEFRLRSSKNAAAASSQGGNEHFRVLLTIAPSEETSGTPCLSPDMPSAKQI